MPENNTPAFQWANWMAAASEAAQRATPTTIIKKEPSSMEKMMGGWQFEGKEKPVTPLICTRCQWIPRPSTSEEPDKSSWCESCIAGKLLGHVPPGPKKPFASPSEDVANYNRTFFGG